MKPKYKDSKLTRSAMYVKKFAKEVRKMLKNKGQKVSAKIIANT